MWCFDCAETPDRPARIDAVARDTLPTVVAATLPTDAFAFELVRDDGPAIGFVMAVLLSLPLWALLIGAGLYVVAVL